LNKRRQEASSPVRFEQFLESLNNALYNIDTLPAFYEALVKVSLRTLKVHHCSLMILEDSFLILKAAAENTSGHIHDSPLHPGKEIADYAAKHRKSLYSTLSDNNLPEKLFKQKGNSLRETFCTVPLLMDDECLGVINFSNKQNAPLTEDDISLIQLFSTTLSHLLYKAFIFQNLQKYRERTASLINALPVGIIVLSRGGKIEYCNQEAQALLERTSLAGSQYEDALPSGIIHLIERFFLRYADHVQNFCMIEEINIQGKEETKPVQAGLCPLFKEDENLDSILLSLRSLALSGEYERMKNIDSIRTNLISMLSHELRTPLTCIKGAIPVLQSRPSFKEDDQLSIKMLDIIERNANQLLKIINNMLDVACIQKNSLGLHFSTFSPSEIIREIKKETEASLKKKRLDLHIHMDRLPDLKADKNKIKKAWYNIVENSIKFSSEGSSIHIRCHHDKKEDALIFSVRDEGRGIAPGNSDKIFTLFWQQDSSHTREAGGSGLGLYIAKNIINAHNGNIWFEHNKTRGVTFYTRLFLKK